MVASQQGQIIVNRGCSVIVLLLYENLIARQYNIKAAASKAPGFKAFCERCGKTLRPFTEKK
jgi:hypothetical protein